MPNVWLNNKPCRINCLNVSSFQRELFTKKGEVLGSALLKTEIVIKKTKQASYIARLEWVKALVVQQQLPSSENWEWILDNSK